MKKENTTGLQAEVVTRFVERSFAERINVPHSPVPVKKREDAPDLVRVETREAWVPFYIDEWIVAVRVVFQGDQPVIGELRVFPNDGIENPSLGVWSAELLGVGATAPQGGLKATFLRRITLQDAEQYLVELLQHPEYLRWMVSHVPDKEDSTKSLLEEIADLKPPRRGRPDIFYARLAEEYVNAIGAGIKTPRKAIAKRRRLPESRIRDMLHEARKRGLLSARTPGKAGGVLTQKALNLLRLDAGRRDTTKEKDHGRKRSEKRR